MKINTHTVWTENIGIVIRLTPLFSFFFFALIEPIDLNVGHYSQLVVEKITIDKANGGAAVYYQNKEMQSLYNPFQIVYTGDTISRLLFKRHDSVWSKNFKRAMASALQVQGSAIGAFVVKEVSRTGRETLQFI